MSALQKGCFFAFLVFVFYLPLPLGGNRPWIWSLNEIFLSLLILLSLFSFTSEQWQTAVNRARWVLWPVSLFTLYSLVQWFSFKIPALTILASVDPAQTWIQLLKSISYIWLILLTALMVTNTKQLVILVSVMIFSGVLQGFYGAILVLGNIDPTPVFSLPLNSRASGSFVYHNHLANFLMLNLCLGFGLLVSQLQHSNHYNLKQAIINFFATFLTYKALLRMALVIMVIALVLTRSRMGNTAFFAALSIGSLLLLLFYKDKPKSLYILVSSIFVIDTLIVSTWFGLEKVKQRLVETSLNAETRDNVVEFALNAIVQQPWTGYGAGSFYSEFQRYIEHSIYIFYDHAHNEYIQFLFESGVIGTALLGVAVLAALTISFHQFITRRDPLILGIALACVMAIIGMLIHISVDFPLQAPATTCYFILTLVIAVLLPSLSQQKKRKRRKGAINSST
ncbi:O-antigen ligase family protein [Motilimonas cestriensis]|uniref:O-antigen ligase family protein n=1 Tax=Motilimonas cestriensis TaxID=2742685 RepID=A0ABS8WBL9_9GAMM|nr:O-antigen ligase [Motilimonas cestriensis]MCE2595098.1 O-antigen ligase family protein [Motilimonas cestriensis]